MGCLIRRSWKRDGKTYRAPKWYGQYRDEQGKIRRVPLARDKRSANQMLIDLQEKADRTRSGLRKRSDDKAESPIAQHVAAYRENVSGCSPRWVSQTIMHIETIIESCGFARLTDIDSADVVRFLNQLSTDRRNADGKIVRGVNAKTRNTYLASMRLFVRHFDDVPDVDQLYKIKRPKEHLDRRHERRAMTPDEAVSLIEGALGRPVERAKFFISMNGRKMTDIDRQRVGVEHALAYKIMLYVAVRKNELATLTWADVDLDGGWLTVRAENAKTGEERTMALRADLIDDLAAWRSICGNVRTTARVLRVPANLVRVLKRDLEYVGIEYVDSTGRFLDNHAFRHTCNTWLRSAGVPDAKIKRHMGHSTRRDMTERYTDLRLLDMHAVVAKLPELPPVAHVPAHVPVLVQPCPRMSKKVQATDRKALAS